MERGLGLARNAGPPDGVLAGTQVLAPGVQFGGRLGGGSLGATGQGDEGAGQSNGPLPPVQTL